MHVLTIKQPWAWAIFHAGKDVENRAARTNHRGQLYIQAGVKSDVADFEQLKKMGHEPPELELLPRGRIIGSVDLWDCVMDADSPWAFPGFAHWRIRRAVLLPEPIPHRGVPWLHQRKESL